MRSVSEAFAAHLASRATTLVWCWKLVRRDGLVFGFTDHDFPVAFDGVTYAPATGLEGGEVSERIGSQTQTSEVLGVIADAAIAEDDILLGRYDGARVESWRVNWRDPGERALIRADTIGEIVREDGVFRAELRSGQHALSRVSGRYYQHLCDARLGDARCGIDLQAPDHRAVASVVAVAGNRLEVAGLGARGTGWASHGTVRWTSGRRIGLVDGIARQEGGVLLMARDVSDWVEPGDALIVHAGCDRQFSTCRQRFGNGVRFRGFPHIPGNDALMRYPEEADRLDGAPLIR